MIVDTEQNLGFSGPFSVIIVGTSGGIGRALRQQILAGIESQNISNGQQSFPAHHIYEINRSASPAVSDTQFSTQLQGNALVESDLERIAQSIKSDVTDKKRPPLKFVFVAIGTLHRDDGTGPEKSWRNLSSDNMAEIFAANAIGPSLVAKHFLPLLPKNERGVFAALSARVGSISDNRLGGWYSYRASKAALNQIIKTAAIELARTKPEAICLGLHPGTVDTDLSKPFQANVAEGKLFTPQTSAAHLLNVIANATPAQSGSLLAWDGSTVPA